MSRNTKIVLGVLAGVLVLVCLCSASVAAGVALFTARARTAVSFGSQPPELVAERVLAVPQGWRTDYTVHVGDVRVLGYRPANGDGHMIFAMLGPNTHADVDKLAEDITKMTDGRYTWMRDEMTILERRSILIGDQEAELVISEGTGTSGTWRQAIVGYQSDEGFTVAILGLPAGQWSDEAVDQFISSLR